MKFVVVALVVLLGVWLWRKNRSDDRIGQQSPKRKDVAKPSPPQIMVSCAVCGIHLPQGEAFRGKADHYCSIAHRAQRET